MENYKTIEKIGFIEAEKDVQALQSLYEKVFSISLEKNKLGLYSSSGHPNQQTFFMGAWENEQLIGACGFVPYVFHSEEGDLTGWQVVWAGCEESRRKKGVFTSLEESGRKECFAKGAAFTFAFPNPEKNSGPIFSGRLGYHPVAISKAIIFPYTQMIQIASHPVFDFHAKVESDFFILQERCRKISGADFFKHEVDGNRLFGIKKANKLILGDIRLVNGNKFGKLIQETFTQSDVSKISFHASENHPAFKLIRFPIFSGKPMMVKFKNEEEPLSLQICEGLKDTFGWS